MQTLTYDARRYGDPVLVRDAIANAAALRKAYFRARFVAAGHFAADMARSTVARLRDLEPAPAGA